MMYGLSSPDRSVRSEPKDNPHLEAEALQAYEWGLKKGSAVARTDAYWEGYTEGRTAGYADALLVGETQATDIYQNDIYIFGFSGFTAGASFVLLGVSLWLCAKRWTAKANIDPTPATDAAADADTKEPWEHASICRAVLGSAACKHDDSDEAWKHDKAASLAWLDGIVDAAFHNKD